MSGLLLYKNLLADSTFTDIGTGDTALSQGFNWDMYKGFVSLVSVNLSVDITFAAASTFNCFALWGHNLQGRVVRILNSVGNQIDTFVIPSNSCFIRSFSETTDTGITLEIDGLSNGSSFKCLSIGNSLTLPYPEPGFTPPGQFDELDSEQTMSINQLPLGGIYRRKPFDFEIRHSDVEPDWISSYYEALANEVMRHPFFYLWSPDHAENACIAWLSYKLAQPKYQNSLYQEFRLRCQGLR